MSACVDCKFCINYRNTKSFAYRLVVPANMFDLRCTRPAFADKVTGEARPCETLRLIECDGQPPLFEPREVKL